MFMAFAIGPNTKPEDALYWHVTGKSPYPEKTTEPNIMNKVVQWIRDESIPTVQKIGMAALGVFATLAIGWIVGKTVLVFTAVTVITLLWAKKEASEIDAKDKKMAEEAQAAARALVEQRESMAKMKEAFGGEELFNLIPNLDLGGRMGDTGYIDFLQPDELVHPVMKGVDKFGRPFIALKLEVLAEGNEDAEEAGEEVLVLFQRYTEGGKWTFAFSDVRILNNILGEADLQQIRNILVEEHPRYALAGANDIIMDEID